MRLSVITLLALSLNVFVTTAQEKQTSENPFDKLGYDPLVATSSRGEFVEFHDHADIVEIGSVLFNTKTNEVVKFLREGETTIDLSSATAAMSIDPHCEKYYWISPYAYCFNNPIRFVDIDGRDPGDVFKTKDAAAKDWGNYYNGASILNNREFASSLYEVGTGYGKNRVVTGYSYSVANEGGPDGASPSTPPNGEIWAGTIHSHGAYDDRYNVNGVDANNNFSEDDIDSAKRDGNASYVTTPDGSLKKYDPNSPKGDNNPSVLSTDLPSDQSFTGKKNENTPIENPNLKYNPAKPEDTKSKFFKD